MRLFTTYDVALRVNKDDNQRGHREILHISLIILCKNGIT